jgi:tRNA(Arg) A34 adenosine deaminase TadA
MTDEQYMALAVEAAKKGLAAGQSPFGAAIVKDGKLVLATHNVVLLTVDSTAHAEVNAIRQACKRLNTIDLAGCTIYSTTEPCPMCFSAIHWAKIRRIVYGASIDDAKKAGFSELMISNETMCEEGGAKIEIVSRVLREECAELLRTYAGRRY